MPKFYFEFPIGATNTWKLCAAPVAAVGARRGGFEPLSLNVAPRSSARHLPPQPTRAGPPALSGGRGQATRIRERLGWKHGPFYPDAGRAGPGKVRKNSEGLALGIRAQVRQLRLCQPGTRVQAPFAFICVHLWFQGFTALVAQPQFSQPRAFSATLRRNSIGFEHSGWWRSSRRESLPVPPHANGMTPEALPATSRR